MKMQKIVEAIKYWSQIFMLPVYWLSFLIPRNKKIWVFGSSFGKRFADNPKYFYLYLNQHKSDGVRAVWITTEKEILELLMQHDLEVYNRYSLKGIWYCLRGKVFIFDNYSKDISFWLSGGAVKVNLWHGIPLKKINLDNRFDRVRNPKTKWESMKYYLRRLSDEKPSHYVLTTSEYLKLIFSSAFGTKKVLCLGYPRNDILTMNIIENILNNKENFYLKKIKQRKKELKGAKVTLYMPTFRESEAEFFDIFDKSSFQDVLIKENIVFCIKPHPKSIVKHKYKSLENDYILILDAELDPYVYLNQTDILITDYSSIYFDYLLLNKPIVFFCYDLEKYLSCSREMYFNYNEYTPGIKVHSFKEILEVLKNIDMFSNEINFKNKREVIKEMMFSEANINASEKLYNYIIGTILGDSKN
jgi:CDP-glycerol glycerophosphotransferase (TagB/SpsB family)